MLFRFELLSRGEPRRLPGSLNIEHWMPLCMCASVCMCISVYLCMCGDGVEVAVSGCVFIGVKVSIEPVGWESSQF